jgi:hypothetical protein
VSDHTHGEIWDYIEERIAALETKLHDHEQLIAGGKR